MTSEFNYYIREGDHVQYSPYDSKPGDAGVQGVVINIIRVMSTLVRIRLADGSIVDLPEDDLLKIK